MAKKTPEPVTVVLNLQPAFLRELQHWLAISKMCGSLYPKSNPCDALGMTVWNMVVRDYPNVLTPPEKGNKKARRK